MPTGSSPPTPWAILPPPTRRPRPRPTPCPWRASLSPLPLVAGNQVNLAWVNPADTATITGFRVERSTDGGVTFPVQFVMAGTAITTYNDTLVSPLTAYMYRVFAFNAMGNSPASNTVSVTTPAGMPNPPMSLSAVAVSGVQVNLTWVAPVGGGAPTSYRIERSANGGGTWPVSFVIASPATLAFSDTTVAPLTAYAYRIFAVNGSGDSLPSNIATVTTLVSAAQRAQQPDGHPDRKAARRVLLNWSDNSTTENGFYIERMILGGVYATLARSGANVISYAATRSSNTTYFYRVRAFRTVSGVSLPSNEVFVTTPVLTPMRPSNLASRRRTGPRSASPGMTTPLNETRLLRRAQHGRREFHPGADPGRQQPQRPGAEPAAQHPLLLPRAELQQSTAVLLIPTSFPKPRCHRLLPTPGRGPSPVPALRDQLIFFFLPGLINQHFFPGGTEDLRHVQMVGALLHALAAGRAILVGLGQGGHALPDPVF